MVSRSESPTPLNQAEIYSALVEALTGRRQERAAAASSSSRGLSDDYDNLEDIEGRSSRMGKEIPSDPRPGGNKVKIGVINPYALVEAMIGRELDRRSMQSVRIISDVLQTDYDELFDLKHRSVLFAGLKLNEKEQAAEECDKNEMRILEEKDLVTPDLADIRQLRDLEQIGFKGVGEARIKKCRMQNGKLRLVVDAHQLGRTVSNREITMSINEIATRYRRMQKGNDWKPPNASWRDMYDRFYEKVARRIITDDADLRVGRTCHHEHRNGAFRMHGHDMGRFDDPVQGATSNSWFIAALFSVFWADPTHLNRNTRSHMHMGGNEEERRHDRRNRHFEVKFHDKGGDNNNRTEKVKVDYEIPINNSSNEPVYARSSDSFEIWPALYEKAFARWVTGNKSEEREDITQLAHGDPVKCMAQITGHEPHYYFTDRHSASELAGVVRAFCVNHKCINPMVAYTHATDHQYRGLNLVSNHAYSVLGYSTVGQGDKQYVVLRNPWGVTEPQNLTSYPGLLDRVEREHWRPATLLDRDGVFALEARAFKEYFACLGVAK